jgi:hypothetical protein
MYKTYIVSFSVYIYIWKMERGNGSLPALVCLYIRIEGSFMNKELEAKRKYGQTIHF